jgi:cell division protein FtsI/penicillin-binding protein 2
MKRSESLRLVLIFSIFVFFYAIVIAKLFYWQVVKAQALHAIEIRQSTENLVTTATRGDILFSDGFPLATNKISYLLYANPKKVDSVSNYSNLLSPVLQMDSATISAILNQNLYWVSLKSRLNADEKGAVEDLKLPALGFEQQTERYYPEASMAAHLVGFVGKNQDGEDQGYFGLEGFYDRQLKGRPGSTYMVKDALGNPILTDIREEKKIDGRTLVTSIDRSIQYMADTELKKGLELYDADGGSVIIMDSKTGKILAASSFPSFDPQDYYDFDGKSYVSRIVSDIYEPGSTFKVLVMAAAIDAGLVTPDTRCNACSGPVKIGQYEIKTWDDKYFPNTTMADVIVHSDNTGMVFVGRKLGVDKMYSYLTKFGIGSTTGIDIQGEVAGDIRPKTAWGDIDLATASFGQGISVTPIELISAVNSIANGGKLMKPMVVDKIITPEGNTINIPPTVTSTPISPETAKIMTWVMVDAAENGESKFAKIPNYRIAGKTGTAQIPVAGHYDPTNTNASFVGFFPADDPKITMLVIVNKPKTSIYGAETAAPIFFNIARDLIQYYNIPPSS